MTSALEKAIRVMGTQAALASSIGASQQRVSSWIKRGMAVPAEFVLPIERATRGQVTRHELRPDLYPAESAAAAD